MKSDVIVSVSFSARRFAFNKLLKNRIPGCRTAKRRTADEKFDEFSQEAK
jgi:hypothetical protein